jgi:hypothetical protein
LRLASVAIRFLRGKGLVNVDPNHPIFDLNRILEQASFRPPDRMAIQIEIVTSAGIDKDFLLL